MKLLVCGGRDYSDADFLNACLDRAHAKRPVSLLIHGGASGADRLAGAWAARRGIPVRAVFAEWEKHGKRAGPIRNALMLDELPDGVVAFPGGRGTHDMVTRARAAGVTVWEPRREGAA